jgi:hypothetical protein
MRQAGMLSNREVDMLHDNRAGGRRRAIPSRLASRYRNQSSALAAG